MKSYGSFKISFRNYHERSNGLQVKTALIPRTSIVDANAGIGLNFSLKSYLGMIMNMIFK
jgi:hypothetical protein